MDNVAFCVYRKGFRWNRISLRMMKSLLFVELSRNYSLKDLPCCIWLRYIDLEISFSFRTFKIAVSWIGGVLPEYFALRMESAVLSEMFVPEDCNLQV